MIMATHVYVTVDDPAIDQEAMALAEDASVPEGAEDEVKQALHTRAQARLIRYVETFDVGLLRFKPGVRPTEYVIDTPSPQYFFAVLRKLQAADTSGNDLTIRVVQSMVRRVRLADGRELAPIATELDSCNTRIATTKWFDTLVEERGVREVLEACMVAMRLCSLPASKRPPTFSPGS